jgi:hypothetical protein
LGHGDRPERSPADPERRRLRMGWLQPARRPIVT